MTTDVQSRSAKTVIITLNAVSALLFFSSWFTLQDKLPTLYFVCAAVLPLVAIGLMSLPGSIYRFGGVRGDSGSNVSLIYMAGAVTMFGCAVRETNVVFLPLTRIFVPALILSLIITAIVVVVDSKTREGMWAAVFALALIYSCGLVVEANKYLDFAPPTIFEAQVLGKRYEPGHRGPPYFYLYVAAWGPFSRPDKVKVSTALYDAMYPGQTVCITLHPGALGMPWYVADPCR